MAGTKLSRMDNSGSVVDRQDEAIDFFQELGMKLKGRGSIDGVWLYCVKYIDHQQDGIEMSICRRPA
ncbi:MULTISPECIES: hypothetical protein [Sphingobacterium]|uniref:hypothetical protein n=1 Tax=Sphingobacterium TaxID=28453 RepID=UPI002243D85D|nr:MULTISPECIES: hypothetical protein [Sphingobacterium]MCW8311913.1 hypothetical protein [Sphingobacterium sp. InxBP1]